MSRFNCNGGGQGADFPGWAGLVGGGWWSFFLDSPEGWKVARWERRKVARALLVKNSLWETALETGKTGNLMEPNSGRWAMSWELDEQMGQKKKKEAHLSGSGAFGCSVL